MSAPICKDCAFCRPAFREYGADYNYPYCAIPSPPEPVQGKVTYEMCEIRRKFRECGKSGTQFVQSTEPKTAVVVRKVWWLP